MDSKKEAASKQKESAKRIFATVQAYRRTFLTTIEGKQVLWDLMKHFHMMQPSMPKGKPDPLMMAFNEGGRNAVLYILAKLNLDVTKLHDLIREANEDANRQI